ncbi:E3 ubiquitin-protein ligase MYLIP-like [Acropora palmata]|uniref:E3 ubiquitin-protein ligase MYLIP-like n=1 Tax=Acropora palmata TaxID=6131 RepID=UPI003DA00B24
MKFAVLEPDGRAHEFVLTGDKLGQEALDKVCEKLGIKEKNYFGLRHSVNDADIWLNLRNPLSTQFRPHLPGKPHRLRLEVKFFVAPQELQQEETRRQFYLCLRKQISEGKFNFTQEKAVQLCALMAQAEYGDFSRPPKSYPQFLSPWPGEDMERKIAGSHRNLEGTSSTIARDAFLNIMSKEDLYDAEVFKARTGRQKVLVAVGSNGLRVYERRTHGKLKQSIGFESIIKMNLSEERLIVVLRKMSENSKLNFVHFFLASDDAAKAIHKAVMEHQLFFYSSKVRQSVLNHYLLPTPCWALPAKWFTKSPSGDLYHLDVKHTRRQSYDLHYKNIHANSDSTEFRHDWVSKCSRCGQEEANVLFTPCGHLVCCEDCVRKGTTCLVCNCTVTSWQRVYFANDAACNDWACQICMDSEINTAFSPCGHICSCESCACHLPYCPICKTFITFVQRVHVMFPESQGGNVDDVFCGFA